jgi:hypothetical protein
MGRWDRWSGAGARKSVQNQFKIGMKSVCYLHLLGIGFYPEPFRIDDLNVRYI